MDKTVNGSTWGRSLFPTGAQFVPEVGTVRPKGGNSCCRPLEQFVPTVGTVLFPTGAQLATM